MKRFTISLTLFLGLPFAALAGVPREIGQAELRDLVATGNSVSLSRVIDVVSQAAPGEPVDVRLFDMGGLFYQIVVVQSSGRVVRVVVNARTGDILSDTSPTAARVRAAITTSNSAVADVGNPTSENAGKSAGAATGGGNGGGNGNGADKGNGNGKGNGNSNGGGNGKN